MALNNHRASAARFQAILKSREIREADITEKTAVFEGFGVLTGDSGVLELDAILNAKPGFLAKRDDSAIRAAAAMGLGRIGTSKAREALNRAAADKDPVVRNAVIDEGRFIQLP